MALNRRNWKPVMTAGLFALLAGTAGAQDAFQEPVDVTFKVRVAVQGNVAAITSGVDVVCTLPIYHDLRESQTSARVRSNLVPAGTVFVPETADGFIERDITLEGYSLPSDQGVEWNCFLLMAGDSGTPNKMYSQRTQPGGPLRRANSPADAGTCDVVGGFLTVNGESTARAPNCAIR